jgi:2-polyprenyl-3-methyl-5-hydroxy-6-metoxy-1,4-benzoquinol methylase
MKHMLPEEWINELYSDYRSAIYNAERIHYEPSYAAVAPRIGSPGEAEIRVAALTRWLGGKMDISEGFSMLDFGGADGRFLPDMAGEKFVYEISDYPAAPGITRIHAAENLETYRYVQLSHVLEHVMQPLALVRKVKLCVAPGGLLYVEVPQEISDERLDALQRGEAPTGLYVHEHVNGYSCRAVARLLECAGLELVAIESEQIDYGYSSWSIVRALGRRNS